jgi:hypothetical protein
LLELAHNNEKAMEHTILSYLRLHNGGEAHGRANRSSPFLTDAPASPFLQDAGCPPGASHLRQAQH